MFGHPRFDPQNHRNGFRQRYLNNDTNNDPNASDSRSYQEFGRLPNLTDHITNRRHRHHRAQSNTDSPIYMPNRPDNYLYGSNPHTNGRGHQTSGRFYRTHGRGEFLPQQGHSRGSLPNFQNRYNNRRSSIRKNNVKELTGSLSKLTLNHRAPPFKHTGVREHSRFDTALGHLPPTSTFLYQQNNMARIQNNMGWTPLNSKYHGLSQRKMSALLGDDSPKGILRIRSMDRSPRTKRSNSVRWRVNTKSSDLSVRRSSDPISSSSTEFDEITQDELVTPKPLRRAARYSEEHLAAVNAEWTTTMPVKETVLDDAVDREQAGIYLTLGGKLPFMPIVDVSEGLATFYHPETMELMPMPQTFRIKYFPLIIYPEETTISAGKYRCAQSIADAKRKEESNQISSSETDYDCDESDATGVSAAVSSEQGGTPQTTELYQEPVDVTPFTVDVTPFTIDVTPFTGNMTPFTVEVAPFTNNLLLKPIIPSYRTSDNDMLKATPVSEEDRGPILLPPISKNNKLSTLPPRLPALQRSKSKQEVQKIKSDIPEVSKNRARKARAQSTSSLDVFDTLSCV